MTIISSLNQGVLTLKLNRPEKFNSFNQEMAFAMQKALHEASIDIAVRAIIIVGEGKAFCAGQDLAEIVDPNGPEMPTIVAEHYNKIILAIRAIEKPIIAAVNGVAAGAGANIALACDVVFAKKSAGFIQAFSKIGLIPDSGGTYFLSRIVGMQKAMALMITGDKVMADDAEKMNMIYKAVEDDLFDATVEEFAIKTAAMPTYGIGLTKRAINQSFTNNLEQQLALEADLQTKAGNSADFKEGVAAFLEKRSPIFIGK
jgi:2-(1,2-epoxy-1,2-dihydrophenyl)acetyl-CoA isomerase